MTLDEDVNMTVEFIGLLLRPCKPYDEEGDHKQKTHPSGIKAEQG